MLTIFEILVSVFVIYLLFKLFALLNVAEPPKKATDEKAVQQDVKQDIKFDPLTKTGRFDLRKEIPSGNALPQHKQESERETQKVLREHVGGDKQKSVQDKMELPPGRIKTAEEPKQMQQSEQVRSEIVEHDRNETVEGDFFEQRRQDTKSTEQEFYDQERQRQLANLEADLMYSNNNQSQPKTQLVDDISAENFQHVAHVDRLDDTQRKVIELNQPREDQEEKFFEEMFNQKLKEKDAQQFDELKQQRKDLERQDKEKIERERLLMEQQALEQQLNLEQQMALQQQQVFQQDQQVIDMVDEDKWHEERFAQKLKEREMQQFDKLEQQRRDLERQDKEKIEQERLSMQKQAEKELAEKEEEDLNIEELGIKATATFPALMVEEDEEDDDDEEEDSLDFDQLSKAEREAVIERRSRQIEKELLEDKQIETFQANKMKEKEMEQLDKLEQQREDLKRQDKEKIEQERLSMQRQANQPKTTTVEAPNTRFNELRKIGEETIIETAVQPEEAVIEPPKKPQQAVLIAPRKAQQTVIETPRQAITETSLETLDKMENQKSFESMSIDQRVENFKKHLQTNQVAEIARIVEQDHELVNLDFSKNAVVAKETGDLLFDNIYSVASAYGNFEVFQLIYSRLQKTSVKPTKSSLYNACRNNRARICAFILSNSTGVDEYERFYTFYQGAVYPLLLRDKFKLEHEMKKLLDVPVVVDSPLMGYNKHKFVVHIIEGKNLAASSNIRPAVKIGFRLKGKNKIIYQWEQQTKKLIAKAPRSENNPKWEEKFVMVCPSETVLVDQSRYSQFGYWGCELTLEVWDKHRIQKSTLLDTLHFDIDEINRAIYSKKTITRDLPNITQAKASITVGFSLAN